MIDLLASEAEQQIIDSVAGFLAEKLPVTRLRPGSDGERRMEAGLSAEHWRDMARLSHGDPATLELHTGGWSGNEDIIDKLSDTLFWMICWESTRRGGHYYFEIPKYLQGGE